MRERQEAIRFHEEPCVRVEVPYYNRAKQIQGVRVYQVRGGKRRLESETAEKLKFDELEKELLVIIAEACPQETVAFMHTDIELWSERRETLK